MKNHNVKISVYLSVCVWKWGRPKNLDALKSENDHENENDPKIWKMAQKRMTT